jgi:predicted kinase
MIRRQPGFLIVSSDHLRKIGSSRRIWDRMEEIAGKGLRKGRSVVIDATNYSSAHRRRFIDLAEQLSCPWLVVYLRAQMPTLLRRNEGREAPIPPGAIHRLSRLFEPPKGKGVLELDTEVQTPSDLADAIMARCMALSAERQDQSSVEGGDA